MTMTSGSIVRTPYPACLFLVPIPGETFGAVRSSILSGLQTSNPYVQIGVLTVMYPNRVSDRWFLQGCLREKANIQPCYLYTKVA
ncbi:hypothetical protein GGP41_007532 [Bipolaris sorokiniana]|uniref:Uncharacterized protein n=1 Tax=Cochliobolus sativus TaxID=45130 RepID=A0A8H5ZAK5_COCSA|nr:hypothetical protein GGP41_007532 [Bipolaris sorokiniana]